MNFGGLSPEEIQQRLEKSRRAWQAIQDREWQNRYQAKCDRLYWSQGKCCAGCDHWASDGALTGTCDAAGIVSGDQVLKSMNISFSSYMPGPGFPWTKAEHVCGLFKDEFDWSKLSQEYLEQIGAWRNGRLRAKP